MPVRVSEAEGRDLALKDVWLVRREYNELARLEILVVNVASMLIIGCSAPLPVNLPWSQCFPQSCEDVRIGFLALVSS